MLLDFKGLFMKNLDLLSVSIIGIITAIWLLYTWNKVRKNKTGLCGTCSAGKCSSKSFACKDNNITTQKITFHR